MNMQQVNKKTWIFWLPLILGIIVLLTTTIECILAGSKFFQSPEEPGFTSALGKVFGPVYSFFYYTTQTNYFVGISLVLLAFMPFNKKIQTLHTATTALITVTFIIYWAAIAPFNKNWSNIPSTIFNIIVHIINPMFAFIVLILFRKEFEVDKKSLSIYSLYPLLYLVCHFIFFGISNNDVVYGFLNLNKPFFIDLTNLPWLAAIVNFILLIITPLASIGLISLWIKCCKIKSENTFYTTLIFNKIKSTIKK